MELAQVEKVSKALADATRLKILYDMAGRQDDCTQCSGIVNMVNLAQASDHTKTLLEADPITLEKEDRGHLYPVNRQNLHHDAAQSKGISL